MTAEAEIETYAAQTRVFGEYHNQIDTLCDGDQAGRILTLRAARELGKYRLYTRKSVVKTVFNKQLRPVVYEGLKSYYLISDVENMRIRPDKGRKSATPEEIRERIKTMQEQGAPSYKIRNAERLLEIACEAEEILIGSDGVLGNPADDTLDQMRKVRLRTLQSNSEQAEA